MMKKDIIMFDLGGILYSIKHSYTHQALRALQRKDAEPIVFSLEQADPIFGLYDSGHINTILLQQIMIFIMRGMQC